MYPRILLLAFTLMMSGNALSQGLRIQLGSESARFMYLTEAFGQDFGRLELEAGLLYNEDSDYLLNLGLLVRGESVSVPMIVAIGTRIYYADLDLYTVGAISIGGDLLVSPESWGGFGIGAYYHTAPGVVAFADAEDLTEYGAYLSYQITPQANLALGYQRIEAEITNVGEIQIDKGGYFAVDISF